MSVHALAKSHQHAFSKTPVPSLTLLAGLGVEGDCHAGKQAQHVAQAKLKPRPANLRQVHLMPSEVLADLQLAPGDVGENIATSDIDLLALGRGDRLHFYAPEAEDAAEPHAVVEVTGLRNPGRQIDKFRKGLRERFFVRDEQENVVGVTAGIMGIVKTGGEIWVGMNIVVETTKKYKPLEFV